MDGTELHPCQWTNCPDMFTSELDMGLHVMNSHLNVLDFGHFILERRPNGSVQGSVVPQERTSRQREASSAARPVRRNRRPVASAPPPESSSRPSRRRGIHSRHQTADDRILSQLALMVRSATESDQEGVEEDPAVPRPPRRTIQIPRRAATVGASRNILMSEAANSLLIRLRFPPQSKKRLFQTEHFCVPCQENCTEPCKRKHRPLDLEVVADWKRLYGHLVPKKKNMLKQLREMIDQYREVENMQTPHPPSGAQDVLDRDEEPEEEEPEDTVKTEEAPGSSRRKRKTGEATSRDVTQEAGESETATEAPGSSRRRRRTGEVSQDVEETEERQQVVGSPRRKRRTEDVAPTHPANVSVEAKESERPHDTPGTSRRRGRGAEAVQEQEQLAEASESPRRRRKTGGIQLDVPEQPQQEIKEEEQEEVDQQLELDVDSDPPTPGRLRHHLRGSTVRGTMKVSKVCKTLLYRIRAMGKVRVPENTEFCLNCLSSGECNKDHHVSERRLAKTWNKYYGNQRVSADSLIEQLEHLMDKYVEKERTEE